MPTVRYRDKDYYCDHLSWYKTLPSKITRPNCVIQHTNLFKSGLVNYTDYSPVLGMNLSVSTFGNYSKTIQMQLDASIHLDKVMIILKMDSYYSQLMHYHASRKILEQTTIALLRSGENGHLSNQTTFLFWHMHIDHISLINNKEIALLMSPKSIVITDYQYDFFNQRTGQTSYELHFDTANFQKGYA